MKVMILPPPFLKMDSIIIMSNIIHRILRNTVAVMEVQVVEYPILLRLPPRLLDHLPYYHLLTLSPPLEGGGRVDHLPLLLQPKVKAVGGRNVRDIRIPSHENCLIC
jgi:hypothetical protein